MNLIHGIDISNNNGAVDIKNVYSKGVEYIYMKATEGSSFKDSHMDTFYGQCKSIGVKSGAYHFLVSTSSPEAQAKNFAEKIAGYKFELMPCLDIEKNFSRLNEFIQRFVSAFSIYSDKELLLYTYTGFLPSINSMSLSMFRKSWIANYNNYADLDSVRHNALSSAGIKIVGHQYTEKGSFGSFTGDCNVFTEDVLDLEYTIKKGTWKVDSKGWWFEYEDKSYPKNTWAKLPRSTANSDNNINASSVGNQNGDKKVNLVWFLFDNHGYMMYSWQKDKGSWYYLGESNDGSMKTGWIFDNEYNKWFYMNDSGVMQTGWQKIDNEWYYLQPTNYADSKNDITYVQGEMRTGWIKYNNKDYLLYSSGKMAYDIVIYEYAIDSNGVAAKK